MDWINVCLTSVSMSIDAMTISAVDGLQEREMKLQKTLFIAFIFGLFQFIMPVIGYFVGYSFKEELERYIPWIAFSILTLLGVKSLIDWYLDFRKKDQEKLEGKTFGFLEILIQGIATSIDALCIGFVYLNLGIGEALLVFGIIGITTFVLSSLTGVFANKLASKLERWASLIAGLVFISIGLKILLEGIL